MSFQLVPKSVTLNDLERCNGVILRYFGQFEQLPGALRKSSRSLSHLLTSSCMLYQSQQCKTYQSSYCFVMYLTYPVKRYILTRQIQIQLALERAAQFACADSISRRPVPESDRRKTSRSHPYKQVKQTWYTSVVNAINPCRIIPRHHANVTCKPIF